MWKVVALLRHLQPEEPWLPTPHSRSSSQDITLVTREALRKVQELQTIREELLKSIANGIINTCLTMLISSTCRVPSSSTHRMLKTWKSLLQTTLLIKVVKCLPSLCHRSSKRDSQWWARCLSNRSCKLGAPAGRTSLQRHLLRTYSLQKAWLL